jgi:outer membrane protein
MKFLFSAVVTAVAAMSASVALAQSAGGKSIRGGITQISPNVTSGNLTAPSLPGTQADVGSSTQPGGGITYMFSDRIAIDLPLATPFEHDLLGAGAIAGVGKIGSVKALPITLMVQYRFGDAGAKVRPYVGIGPTYAKFFGTEGTAALTGLTGGTPAAPTTLSVASKFTATVQAGVIVGLSGPWFVDAMIARTPLKTTTTLSTGQTLESKLDPTTASVALGYRF